MQEENSQVDPKWQSAQLNLEEIVRLSSKVGIEYSEARRLAERLDLLKATERARAMLRYDDGTRSEAKIRRLAEADEQYVEFLEALSEAKAQSDKLRIKYESYKNLEFQLCMKVSLNSLSITVCLSVIIHALCFFLNF